jgi:putative transposase
MGESTSKSRVCKELQVSRASLYWKSIEGSRGRYVKKDDEAVLEEVNEVIEERATYGYKRVTAMINKKRKLEGHSIFNRKRVYRVMDMNGLLLKKELEKRTHKATGKIITLHSNTRWCSDGFEIHCYNGEKVYVAFCLDTHDREAISYVAYDRPLLAVDIQKLMIESVSLRFSKDKAPREIQFLSDRGSIYRAKETVEMGRRVGLKSCFTKAYTPQSNGMSESLVGTIKRDYVYTSDCVDAKATLKMISGWFKDYNEVAPHSGLGMMSPLEYKKVN